jgi:fucose permease
LHYTIGQRGIAFFGALCRLIGYVPLALHPSYFPLLPVVMLFTGFGNGINDSAWNAYVGNLRGPNELLGVLHGVYGLGGTIAPLVASVMVAKLSLGWYTYFYLMIAISCVELVTGVTAFWAATGADYRKKLRFEGGRKPMTTTALLRSPIAWLVSAFLFGYVGVEVCLGGWIPTFMLEVRHTDGFVAGLTVTLFWFALTLGRVALGFVTGRIGEKMAVTVYLCLCIIMQIVYWVVPDFAVSIVAVVLLGFFLGPLYPGVIAALTKLLPRDQHVATIGFASAIGGGGAALFPFLVGALAEDNGVQVLQPFVVALLAVIVLLWLAVPGGLMQGGLEKARENNEAVGSRLWRIFSAGKD